MSLAPLLPLFLKLEGRAVLVVGAGAVAERKIADLVDAKARVRVVSPEATPKVQELAREGHLVWDARPFDPSDIEGAWLAFAATNDAAAQKSVAQAAEGARVFLVAIDDLPNTSAYSGAHIRRPPFTIAISSSGATPALTRLVRENLEQALPEEGWVEAAQKLREKWRADGLPMGSRFADLLRAFRERAG